MSLVALAELVWVLRSVYGAGRGLVVDIVDHLLADRRFVVQQRDAAWAALDVYKTLAVDFGDSLIAALDRGAGCAETFTFDRGATRIPGMRALT